MPRACETPHDVVGLLAHHTEELRRHLSAIGGNGWDLLCVEPSDNIDLGPSPLHRFALLRLTEVEVHGSDLEIGLDEWSELFVSTSLPSRLTGLSARSAGESVARSWLLIAIDGPTYLVSGCRHRGRVPPDRAERTSDGGDRGTSRDPLALML